MNAIVIVVALFRVLKAVFVLSDVIKLYFAVANGQPVIQINFLLLNVVLIVLIINIESERQKGKHVKKILKSHVDCFHKLEIFRRREIYFQNIAGGVMRESLLIFNDYLVDEMFWCGKLNTDRKFKGTNY